MVVGEPVGEPGEATDSLQRRALDRHHRAEGEAHADQAARDDHRRQEGAADRQPLEARRQALGIARAIQGGGEPDPGLGQRREQRRQCGRGEANVAVARHQDAMARRGGKGGEDRHLRVAAEAFGRRSDEGADRQAREATAQLGHGGERRVARVGDAEEDLGAGAGRGAEAGEPLGRARLLATERLEQRDRRQRRRRGGRAPARRQQAHGPAGGDELIEPARAGGAGERQCRVHARPSHRPG